MSKIKSTLMIRDYNNIRELLRDVYIFGCFTRDDFIQKGMSGRKYDNERRRIQSYLPNDFLRNRRENNKVLQYCTYNITESAKNHMAQTYQYKSFTRLDIMSYFFVFQILENKGWMTLSEILDEIPLNNRDVVITNENLRTKLNEYIEFGFLESKQKQGRNYYRLKIDIWSLFSKKELLEIDIFLDFLKNVNPFEMPYYLLQKRLKLYLEVEYKMSGQKTDIFQFKHNHIFDVLDNEIMYECLKAMYGKRSIKIKEIEGNIGVVIPIKIIYDSTYGRQYLRAYNIESKLIRTIRLDKIADVKQDDFVNEEYWFKLREQDTVKDGCWCTSIQGDSLNEVQIEFCFDEIEEAYILNRIQREGHGGSIHKVKPNVYLYSIMVSDPEEMIPWIRSFGERARVIKSGEKKIENTIKNDWLKAVQKYEDFSRDFK